MKHRTNPYSATPCATARTPLSTVRRTLGLVALSLLVWHPRLDAATPPVVETVYSFTDAKAPYPIGSLVEDAEGNFYGVTAGYPSESYFGTVFQLTPKHQLDTLYTFTGGSPFRGGVDGEEPGAGPILSADGTTLFGTTSQGGTNGQGTIYQVQLTPTVAYQSLFSFTAPYTDSDLSNATGADPYRGLVADKNNNLYGAAHIQGPDGDSEGGGTIFEYTAGGAFNLLHSFSGDDGAGSVYPDGSLVRDADGNLFGVTYEGGPGDNGSVGPGTAFEIPSGGAFKTIANFEGFSPADQLPSPVGGLVVAGDGNFYGVTEEGGTDNDGTVFQMTPAGKLTILHSFTGTGTDGKNPEVPLVLGKDGNLYGTTNAGGSSGDGTIFKITLKGKPTTLYSFAATTYPQGLVQGRDGNIYGVTEAGGSANYGTIYVLHTLPVITSAANATATVGQFFSYQIEATNDPTRYGVAGLPKGLSVDAETGLLTGTPEAAGTRKLTLQAANAFGLGTAPLTLTIKTPPPVITSAKTATAFVGEAFKYQIIATYSPTSYGVLGLFKGITVDQQTGLISGTPTAAGTHTLTLKAANPGGTGMETLTLTVKVAPPVITSAKSATATVGKAFSYQITATGNPTKYGVGGLFKGLTVNAQTGLISGTPTAAGTHTLTLQAVNAGGTGTETFTLTVKAD